MLPISRQAAGSLIDFSQSSFCTLVAYLSMGPSMSVQGRINVLAILVVASLTILFKSSVTFQFFDHRINKVDLWMKVSSTSFHCSQLAVVAINRGDNNKSFMDLIVIWIIMAVIILGTSLLMMKQREERMLERVSYCNSLGGIVERDSHGILASNQKLDVLKD